MKKPTLASRRKDSNMKCHFYNLKRNSPGGKKAYYSIFFWWKLVHRDGFYYLLCSNSRQRKMWTNAYKKPFCFGTGIQYMQSMCSTSELQLLSRGSPQMSRFSVTVLYFSMSSLYPVFHSSYIRTLEGHCTKSIWIQPRVYTLLNQCVCWQWGRSGAVG